MDVWTDYEDDMIWPSAELAEDVLSGRKVEDPRLELLAVQIADLRAGLSDEVPSHVAALHIMAMGEAARSLPQPRSVGTTTSNEVAPRRPMRRRIVGIALAAALILVAAIAAALTLPDRSVEPAEDRLPASADEASRDTVHIGPEGRTPGAPRDIPSQGGQAKQAPERDPENEQIGSGTSVDTGDATDKVGGGGGGGNEIGSGGGSGGIDGGGGGGGTDFASGGGSGGVEGGGGGGGNGLGSGGGGGGPQGGGGGGPQGGGSGGPPEGGAAGGAPHPAASGNGLGASPTTP